MTHTRRFAQIIAGDVGRVALIGLLVLALLTAVSILLWLAVYWLGAATQWAYPPTFGRMDAGIISLAAVAIGVGIIGLALYVYQALREWVTRRWHEARWDR